MNMVNWIKISFYVVLCMLFATQEAYAQVQTSLGVRTGLVFSNYTQTEIDFDSNVDGWIAVSLEFKSDKSPIFFISEYSYKGLGAHLYSNPPNGRTRTQLDNNYIGFSPMVGMTLFEEKKLSPRFYLGPNVDFLTDSKLTIRRDDGITGGDVGSGTAKRVFGFNIGAGLDWELGPVGFTLDGRFTSTFTSVYTDGLLNGGLNDVKHEYFGVMIGLHFPFRYK